MNAINRSASFLSRAARRLRFAVAALIRLDGPPTPGRYRQLLDENGTLRDTVIKLRREIAMHRATAEAAEIEVRVITAMTERIIQRDTAAAARHVAETEVLERAKRGQQY